MCLSRPTTASSAESATTLVVDAAARPPPPPRTRDPSSTAPTPAAARPSRPRRSMSLAPCTPARERPAAPAMRIAARTPTTRIITQRMRQPVTIRGRSASYTRSIGSGFHPGRSRSSSPRMSGFCRLSTDSADDAARASAASREQVAHSESKSSTIRRSALCFADLAIATLPLEQDDPARSTLRAGPAADHPPIRGFATRTCRVRQRGDTCRREATARQRPRGRSESRNSSSCATLKRRWPPGVR
jgi:hypothetical protein